MRPLRLLIVTGTRAEFGIWRVVLATAADQPDRFEPRILVTGMHLDERFGATVHEIRALGVPIAAEIPATPVGDGRADMAASLGHALVGMAPVLAQEAPDWLLLLGDRGEQLAAALGALHIGTPIAHLHGGEVTRGAVDDAMRDMISRAAHLHLVATEEAAVRLRSLGEEDWRIRVVGAPGLDLLAEQAGGDIDALRSRHGLGDGPYLLMIQHPETIGTRDPVSDLEQTLAAVQRVGVPTLAILPNADFGGRAMAERLAASAAAGSLAIVASLARADYATLLAHARALVGNSSSGIIEAPMLGVPAVNVGDRQAGRTRGDNVIDVRPVADEIEAAIRRVLAPGFATSLSHRSPYGDGKATPRILDALLTTPRDERLIVKRVGGQ